jgi:hypothetical protein
MHATIPELDLQNSSVGTISVGQVGIGPIQIGKLVITNLAVDVAAAGAHLHNFRVTISLAISLDWHIHIDIPFLPGIDEGGTLGLGDPSFTCDLGDVSIPGLQNLAIKVAELSADSVAATVSPVDNIQLGAATAQQIQVHGVTLPIAGFTIAGAGIGTLQAAGIGVPAASVDSVAIGNVHGDAFPVGGVTISNLALPGASIADIVSQSVDATATPQGKAFHFDLGILEETLKLKPTARAQIDQLTISHPTADASLGSIELQNVVAPYELLNLTLSQIGIETLQIPAVSIS